MYVMRRAQAADRSALVSMILARSAWMEARGWPSWRGSAEGVASLAGKPTFPMWVLERGGRIVGTTTAAGGTLPDWLWSEQERAESSWYLNTTLTDPAFAGQGLGTLMAWWALDRAAREGAVWVRRGADPAEGLVRLYKRQGFEVVRQVEHHDAVITAMQAPAALQPDLPVRTLT